MIRILFLCLISTRHAQSVSWTVGTSVPRFNQDLKLVCTVPTGCCSSSDRIWANGTGSQILNNGNTAFPDKYEEDWDPGNTTGFSMIIKNLQMSDVGVDYDCQYNIGFDKHTLTQDATWEYVPTVQCEIDMHYDENDFLSGKLIVPRSTSLSSINAEFGGQNLTVYLSITGPSNYDTWFYRWTVSIKRRMDCVFAKKFTLKVVIGTATINVCDNKDICECINCIFICLGTSTVGQVIGSVILIIFLFKYGEISCKKGGLLLNGCIILRMALMIVVITTALGLLPTITIGLFECPCKENLFWIFFLFWSCGIGLVSTLILGFFKFDWSYVCGKTILWKCGMLIGGFFTSGFLILCYAAYDRKMLKGGNNQSTESGSLCWPPCSVGQDPNSPDPENARSLLKKKTADKNTEEKPVAVVRSQPQKARHVMTDNTESTKYLAENEKFSAGLVKGQKPRPLPSIGQPIDSPRPLPQMPRSTQQEKGGIQLQPLGDSTSEKKKKKKRKKEIKNSDEED